MDAKINRFVVDLYHASREIPLSAFQEWTLEHLHNLISFDGAWWGRGANDPLAIHQVHLHRCSPRLAKDYKPWIGCDFFRERVCANPGVTVNASDIVSREELQASTIYREFARKHRLEWSLGTVLVEPISSLNEFVTVWRSDARKPFSEHDRTTKQVLMPHLVEAFRNCRLFHLIDERERKPSACWGLCDRSGLLLDVHPRFVEFIVLEWPDWGSARLPEALRKSAAEEKTFVGRRIVINARSVATDMRILEARHRGAVDLLSARERQVVDQYCQGRTHMEIATLLGLAPATVRNLISRAYRKLDVSNKSELASRLRA